MPLSGPTQRGVSMIELLVVMAIIAIMLGWGGAHMVTHLSEYRLKAAVRDLISTMQKARMTAVRNNAETAVFFDPANGTYSLCTGSGDGNWGTRGDNICLQERRLVSYDSGIGYGHGSATKAIGDSFGADEISYTWNRVAFTPMGTAGHAGYAYIENDKGQTAAVGTITIGTILSQKWDGDSWEHN
ncbi:MAG: GspH/FimT family pseudopilin [Desulfoplanes sp.]|nr:GspH/FimT family pseudopilin [Desulfoplanes sp.]